MDLKISFKKAYTKLDGVKGVGGCGFQKIQSYEIPKLKLSKKYNPRATR